MRKKLLSLLLAALMILGLLPAAALAAEGDAAPTVTVGDTSYPVTDTGMTSEDGATIYHTLVPAGTAAVNVDWALLKDNLGKYEQDPSIRCSGWHENSVTYAGSPVTVSLSGHFDEGNDDESNALDMGDLSAEQIAKFKTDASNKMVVMVMRWAGAITDAPAGGVLCIELIPTSGGETGDTTNHAPTLREGVEESVRKYGFEDIAWELDLSAIFTDADGDKLTYKVSVNGTEPVEAAEKYSYVCGTTSVTLTFTANDGKADSDKTYTVTLYSNRKTIQLKDSGASEVAAGKTFSLSMYSIFKDPDSTGKSFYYSINGAEKEFFGSGQPNGVAFKRAFEKPGTYTLEFYAQHGPTFIGPYTHTLTVTGEAIENHAPVVQNPTEGPGQLGSGVNVTYWKPDLASIFSDPDGDTLTYSYSIDGARFSDYYTSVGIHADYLAPDGTHTVTIRATDPYGEYAEFTVTIEKSTNHAPTKKADAPSSLSVFVPVGITYEVDANLYYEDVDAKDQGNLRFKSNRYGSAGKYTASAVGDTKIETAYGNDTSNVNAFSGIEITYTAIGIDDENAAITNGETYSRNLAELNFPGNYKVRINGGAEQDAAESYTFTPSKPGKYYLHFYGSQTKTAEQNYVVKLTVQPNGTEPAPMTVTIGEKNYDVKLTALVGSKSWFGGPDDVPFYLTAVPADFETLTLTVDKQDNTVKEVVCGEFEPVEGSGTVYTVKNHTCFTGDLDVNVSDVIDTSKYGVIPVLIQDTTGQYTVLLIQVGGTESETEFVPSIGNGAGSESTTTEGVTTFPAGSGSGAPTVTVTAPASGWAAGENTFTVACDKACVVLVKSGGTYTKLTAANSGETHSFTANLAEGDEIIVRLKGDVNGDGVVNNTDTIQARAASLGKATLTEINAACAKVVGGTAVTNTDVIQIGAVALGKAAFQW